MAESSDSRRSIARLDLPHKDAGLHPPNDFSDDQRAAFAKAYVVFRELASRKWNPPSPSAPPAPCFTAEIEEVRFCPNVLIDGGRGLGKTVVFLWLLEYWRILHRRRIGSAPQAGSDESVERKRLDDARRALKQGLEDSGLPFDGKELDDSAPAPWIVPLRIIDLQPLPPTTDVSLLIGMGFRLVLDALRTTPSWMGSGGGRSDRCRGRLTAADEYGERRLDPLEHAWDRFVFASAFGSQRLRERSERLDLETYRYELEESQRGAEIALAFPALIDVITVEFAKTFGSPGWERHPFFVIPIDDADMNPARTGELIWLLGTLRHPRVGFLLTGDSALLRDKVNETLRGCSQVRDEWSGARGKATSEEDIDSALRLGRVASAIVEKVLPPAHRCRLNPLRGVVRKGRLAQVLKDVPARAGEMAFEGLFGPGEFTDLALPGTLRRCQSLESFIRELLMSRETDDDPRFLIARRLWKDRVKEMSLPDPYWRFVRDAVRIREISDEARREPSGSEDDPGGGILTIATDLILSEPLSREVDGGSLARRTNRRFQTWSYSVREILDYRISLQVEKGSASDFPLSDDVGAAFILASNLAAEAPRARFVGEPTCPRGAANPFVGVSFHWIPEGGTVRLRWPLPEWTSYRDAHRFQRLFLRAIRSIPPRGEGMNLDRYLVPFAAAAAWVGLFRGFENARCEKWADGEPHAAEGEHLSKVLLDKVAEASQFDAGFDEAALRAVAVLTWIEERWEEYKAGPPARLPAVLQRGVVVWTWLRTRVPLLLLPEGGLSMQYAAALGKALDGVEPLGASGTGLKAHREAWLGSALASFPGVGLSYLRDLEEEGPQGTHDKVVRAVMRALDHEFRGWPLSPGSGRRAPRERKLTT